MPLIYFQASRVARRAYRGITLLIFFLSLFISDKIFCDNTDKDTTNTKVDAILTVSDPKNNESKKEISELKVDTEQKPEQKIDKDSVTKGYFRTQTSFFDKKGNPKLLNKDFRILNFQELEHNYKIYKKNNDQDAMLRYTERMITHCKDPDRICKLKLEYADIAFDLKKYTTCSVVYSNFAQMYPGNEEIERVLYRAILSKFALSLPADKDQTITKEALKDAKEFISNRANNIYRKKVKAIIKECNKKLLDHELNNFNFYLDKKNIVACQKRLEYIKKNFPKIPYNKFVVEELEKQIEAVNNNELYKPKYEITTNSTILNPEFFKKKQQLNKNVTKNKPKVYNQDTYEEEFQESKQENNLSKTSIKKVKPDYVKSF